MDAQMAPPGRSGDFPGTPRVARSPPKASPGRQRRSVSLPGSCPRACGTPSAVERAFRSIFRCFCVVARKLRCAFRIIFNGVLLTSHVCRVACASARPNAENRTKIIPKSSQNGSKISLGASKTSKKCPTTSKEATRIAQDRKKTPQNQKKSPQGPPRGPEPPPLWEGSASA